MLQSSLNFAVGFFGLPLVGKYQQSITIEAEGVCLGDDSPFLSPLFMPFSDQQYAGAVRDVSKAMQAFLLLTLVYPADAQMQEFQQRAGVISHISNNGHPSI
jgi:hypothetical protein